MSKISSLDADIILDSRGENTIAVTVTLDSGVSAGACVPEGASVGKYEAHYLEPDKAVKVVKTEIKDKVKGTELKDQKNLDSILIELDGTDNKNRLGANSILGVSLAYARAVSIEREIPLWKYIREQSGIAEDNANDLRLMANVVNGGMHAGNNLDFQEYLFITNTKDIRRAVGLTQLFYRHLEGELVDRFGEQARNVGDEGGFAPDFNDNIEPLIIMGEIGLGLGKEGNFNFGIDAAANSIDKSSDELNEIYNKMRDKVKLSYIEDAFKEDDKDNFKKLTESVGDKIIVCGDDITVTDSKKIKEMAESKAINGVIIKPNQIGTLAETLEAVRVARENSIKVVVSHRSGETNDDFISDLAYGVCAYGFKLGAPERGERISKYNRLLEITEP